MRILFIRHGHPNYKDDCLTELGKKQAAAVAERLAEEGIDKLFCSPLGRAHETASYIGAKIGLEAEPLEFIREIGWGSQDGMPLTYSEDGHPWKASAFMAVHSQSLHDPNWQEQEPFLRNAKLTQTFRRVREGCDPWLASLGVIRDGEYYRLENPKWGTVCMVSHAGAFSVVLSHMLNLDLPFVFAVLEPHFTSVTELRLGERYGADPGTLFTPTLEVLNDSRHIRDCWAEG